MTLDATRYDREESLADLDAERAVLGALVGGGAYEDDLAEAYRTLQPRSFHSQQHAAIFAACAALYGEQAAVDELTVQARLRDCGTLDEAGGAPALATLVEATPTAANLKEYARRVEEKAKARELRALAVALKGRAGAAGTRELAEEFTSKLQALGETRDVLTERWRWMKDRDNWLTSEPAPRRYLLNTTFCDTRDGASEPRGFLPLGIAGMLIGEGGVAKSWALTLLALCVATGRRWFDSFDVAEPGPVLLALAEEDDAEIRRRLYYGAQLLGLTPQQRELASARIMPLGLRGVSVTLAHSLDELAALAGGGPRLSRVPDAPFFADLRRKLERSGIEWRLLILDPVSRFANADAETDNAAATRFVQTLERLTNAPGQPTVLVAHHTNKSARGADPRDQGAGAARGASGLTDGVRWCAGLKRLPRPDGAPAELPDLAVFALEKSNYTSRPDPITMARDVTCHGALRAATDAERRMYRAAKDTGKREAKAADSAATDSLADRGWT